MILLGKDPSKLPKVSNLVTWLWPVLNKQTKIQLLLLTSAFSQVAKIVLTSSYIPYNFLQRLRPLLSPELIMNMSKTSKRSSLLLFLSEPSHNFPLYLSLLWLLRLRVNTPNTTSPPCDV